MQNLVRRQSLCHLGPSRSEHTLQSSEDSVENHGTGILIGRLQKWLLVLTGVGGNEEEVRVKKTWGGVLGLATVFVALCKRCESRLETDSQEEWGREAILGGDNVCNIDHFLQIGHGQLPVQSKWKDRSLTCRDAKQGRGFFLFPSWALHSLHEIAKLCWWERGG